MLSFLDNFSDELDGSFELIAPSRIDGDVTTATLVVQEGAVLNGRCTMGAAAKAGATIGVESVAIGKPAAEAPRPASKAG